VGRGKLFKVFSNEKRHAYTKRHLGKKVKEYRYWAWSEWKLSSSFLSHRNSSGCQTSEKNGIPRAVPILVFAFQTPKTDFSHHRFSLSL